METKHFTSFDGSTIVYDVLGKGKKKVFLLHGLMNDRTTWLNIARALTFFHKDLTVYVPELRAHGRSTNNKFDSLTPFLDIARDIDGLANSVLQEGEKAILVCYSLSVVPGIMMQKYGLGQWVEKYFILDHPLEFVKDDPIRTYFWAMGKEFEEKGISVQKYIDENKTYCENLNLEDVPEDYKKQCKRIHEIIVHCSLYNGRLGFLKNLGSILNETMMIFSTSFYTKWMQYNSIGSHYFYEELDLGEVLRDSKIPTEFGVGMKNGVFYSDWNIETINKWMPGSKVYKFHHSGHAILTTEPINVYKALKEAIGL